MYGPSRPDKDVHTLEHTNGLHCRKLLDPGWLYPDILATTTVRIACVAGLKSIYIAGQGASSTRGPVKVSNDVEVILFTREWEHIPPSGLL